MMLSVLENILTRRYIVEPWKSGCNTTYPHDIFKIKYGAKIECLHSCVKNQPLDDEFLEPGKTSLLCRKSSLIVARYFGRFENF